MSIHYELVVKEAGSGAPEINLSSGILREKVTENFDRECLSRCFNDKVEDIDTDLLTLLFAISRADRRALRRISTGWMRQLSLSIPVHNPEIWNRLSEHLAQLLNHSTGDRWEFKFFRRNHPHLLLQSFVPDLPASYRGGVVIPYSGGLDSFVGLNKQLANDEPVLIVHVRHGGRKITDVLPPDQMRLPSLEVPFTTGAGEHAEPSYRSRSFIFFSLAALACRNMKGKTIALPEAGQGCLGPSFVPFGLEFPYRGCHPVFIEKIRSFYDNLWQWSPPFVQENLWLTKGQALAELSGNAGFTYWDQTNSCSRNVRRRGGQNAPYVRQCGLCSGCLFRRMSLLWAKLESENETNSYLFDAFTLEKLPARLERGPKQQSQQAFFFEGDSKSLDPKVPKQNGHGASDAEVLVYGAVGLDELAQLSQRPQSYTSHVDELSCALGRQRPWVEEKVSTLLAQHAKEWQTFKDALAKNSFLRRCLIA